jgi:hypothetical protein
MLQLGNVKARGGVHTGYWTSYALEEVLVSCIVHSTGTSFNDDHDVIRQLGAPSWLFQRQCKSFPKMKIFTMDREDME